MTILQTNTLLQNRYTITRLISKGLSGAVYQAIDQRDKSSVALKHTLAGDEHMQKILAREARILARLQHRTLPVFRDFFTDDSGQFLVMDYIHGEDLGLVLERKGKSFPTTGTLNWIIRWADQLLEVLEYLHTQSPPIIHRDIKPRNLKVTPNGDIVLLDFGISKSAEEQTAIIQNVRGCTQSYLPLEQIQGTGTDARSDLYALAATLHHLMTGEPPPDALSRVSAMLTGQPDPLRSIHEINPLISPGIALVIHQAMEQKMADRFNSAKAMRMALNMATKNSGSTSSSVPKSAKNGEKSDVSNPSTTSGQSQPITNSGGIQTIVTTPHQSFNAAAFQYGEPNVRTGIGVEKQPMPFLATEATESTQEKKQTSPFFSQAQPQGMVVVDQRGGGTHRTVSEAIKQSQPYARLLIRPGTYNEHIVLDKPLELIGNGPMSDIIFDGTGGTCVDMQTDYAFIRGITIRSRGTANKQPLFAVDVGQGRLVVERCDISSDTLACVAIHGVNARPSFWKCKIHSGKNIGVFIYDHGQGILENCLISQHIAEGIRITQGSNPIVRQCTITRNKGVGISWSEQGSGIVEACDIFENEWAGIEIKQASTPYIKECNIHHQISGYGISFEVQGEGIVEGCTIFGNNSADIRIVDESRPLIWKCTISEEPNHHSSSSSNLV